MRALTWIGVLHPTTGNVTAKPTGAPPAPEFKPPNRSQRRAAQANSARGPKPLPGAYSREQLGKATSPAPSTPDAS